MTPNMNAATEAMQSAMAQIQQSMDNVAKATQDQVDQVNHQLIAAANEATALNRANIDALMESTRVVSGGVEQAGRRVGDLTQSLVERSLTVGQALMGAKQPNDVVELQRSLVADSANAVYAEMICLSRLSLDTFKAAVQPLNSRMTAVMTAMAPKAA